MRSAAITSKNWSKIFSQVDLWLLGAVLSLVMFGLLMVYSSSYIYATERTGDGLYFIKKQFLFSIAGLASLIAGSKVSMDRLKAWTPALGLCVLALLGVVLIPGVGTRVGGAQRWISLGFFHLQPGEIAKLVIILILALQLEKKQKEVSRFVPGIVSPVMMVFPFCLLLILQPDFGSTVMITLTTGVMLYLGGVRFSYLLSIGLSAIIGGALLVLSSPYRKARLMTFLDPWADPSGKGFQVLQSWVGLHRGGVWGVGLGNGKEKLFYLPEAHNDFILSVVGEELGFVGIAALICAFIFLSHRGLKIAFHAWNVDRNAFSSLVAGGITAALSIQAITNMAVVLGLLPTKGLTLPFVSYGGSALLINLFAVGLLLSISKSKARQK